MRFWRICKVGLITGIAMSLTALHVTLYALGDGADIPLHKITRDEAIAIANKEVLKWELNPIQLIIKADESEKAWESHMEIYKISPGAREQERYQKMSARVKGRNYWTIQYHSQTPGGRISKDGGGTVIVDSTTGEVLFTSCAHRICD